MKLCGRCKLVKDRSEFNKSARCKDGLCAACRKCSAERNAEWRKKNPDGFKVWKEKNKEHRDAYCAEWDAKNKERKAANYKAWAQANSAKLAAKYQLWYVSKVSATPPWADMAKIQEFYEEAARLTKLTGIRHEVDHIFPLKGENSRGLHCEYNLQILTRSENASKKNRMPSGF